MTFRPYHGFVHLFSTLAGTAAGASMVASGIIALSAPVAATTIAVWGFLRTQRTAKLRAEFDAVLATASTAFSSMMGGAQGMEFDDFLSDPSWRASFESMISEGHYVLSRDREHPSPSEDFVSCILEHKWTLPPGTAEASSACVALTAALLPEARYAADLSVRCGLLLGQLQIEPTALVPKADVHALIRGDASNFPVDPFFLSRVHRFLGEDVPSSSILKERVRSKLIAVPTSLLNQWQDNQKRSSNNTTLDGTWSLKELTQNLVVEKTDKGWSTKTKNPATGEQGSPIDHPTEDSVRTTWGDLLNNKILEDIAVDPASDDSPSMP